MKGYRLILTYLLMVLLMIVAVICGGCTSVKYVPVESVKTDTVYQSSVKRDSVYLHDSVYVREWMNGDTVFRDRDRWRTKYVLKEVHDTLYQSRVDSVAVPYPVEKELTWWQRQKIAFGELAMIIMAGLLCFVVIKSKLK